MNRRLAVVVKAAVACQKFDALGKRFSNDWNEYDGAPLLRAGQSVEVGR
jgi:hypothetical protein